MIKRETSGDCLPGCEDEAQCSHAQQTCNTDSGSECLTGLVHLQRRIPPANPASASTCSPRRLKRASRWRQRTNSGSTRLGCGGGEMPLVSVNSTNPQVALDRCDSSASYIVNKLLGVEWASMPFQGTRCVMRHAIRVHRRRRPDRIGPPKRGRPLKEPATSQVRIEEIACLHGEHRTTCRFSCSVENVPSHLASAILFGSAQHRWISTDQGARCAEYVGERVS